VTPRIAVAPALPVADPVLGFYGPDSQMWRLNREAVLLGAGPAALLLQLAHPLVAEGVAHHSEFEADPWRRLRGTLRTTLALVFGDAATADRAVQRLNAIHADVRGLATDPQARRLAPTYRALDPELLLWVQATLIWTSAQAYERWVGPLAPEDREAFWAEARRVGQRLGIPLDRSPADWPAFEAYWATMVAPEGPIQVTPTARRLAAHIVPPPIAGLPRPVAGLLALPAVGLLPARIRDGYGLPWSPTRAALARGLDTGLRAWTAIMPASWRAMPQARAAERRAARHGGRPARYDRRAATLRSEPNRA
jgi:uncharacterized protein (DUF2236 family)